MAKKSIPVSTLIFLKDLKKNNDRDWFAKHKDRYLAECENMAFFSEALLTGLRKQDHIETESGKKSLYRIYRDVRFSEDKTPYKTTFNGGFKRATKLLRGGYYFHIEPSNSFIAGGFFGPNPEDLKRIRQDIDHNHEEWRTILKNKTFTKYFNQLQGECVKTAPRGYLNDHPVIDLLRHKQFLLRRNFSNEEVLSPAFPEEALKTYRAMKPFFDHMSQVLTTDANGLPIY